MKKIVVLGGTGFVGKSVCEHLVRSGWHVTVPTRRARNAKSIQHMPGLTVRELDVHNEEALTQVLQGADAVVNLIAILHGNAAAFAHVHLHLVEKISRACGVHNIAQLVHVSALGASPVHPQASPSNYLRSKGQGEAVLFRYAQTHPQCHVRILRPSVIFGADDAFLNVFAQLQRLFPFIPLAGAQAKFQPVWVQDVALAVVRVLVQPQATTGAPSCYELGGPEVWTLRQLVDLAGKASGVRNGLGRPIGGLPMWMGRLQALLMELAPGQPLMSRDNLDSMRVDNVLSSPRTTGAQLANLQSLGITPAALEPIARGYLNRASKLV